ncbi:hypothetical protein BKA70DRAFT_1227809 [Coprinopsis sp. MPI-PUGE-AT-0042]|nr:hypothetical protein BKA70DRAFT_1227809 [Coprinopsis sp. MPI-PUGE-AT-0042]
MVQVNSGLCPSHSSTLPRLLTSQEGRIAKVGGGSSIIEFTQWRRSSATIPAAICNSSLQRASGPGPASPPAGDQAMRTRLALLTLRVFLEMHRRVGLGKWRDTRVEKSEVGAYVGTTTSATIAPSDGREEPTSAIPDQETAFEHIALNTTWENPLRGVARFLSFDTRQYTDRYSPERFDPDAPPEQSSQGMFVDHNTFPPTRQPTDVSESGT